MGSSGDAMHAFREICNPAHSGKGSTVGVALGLCSPSTFGDAAAGWASCLPPPRLRTAHVKAASRGRVQDPSMCQPCRHIGNRQQSWKRAAALR